MATNKSEYRISKFETIAKIKNSNDQDKLSAAWVSNGEVVLTIKEFGFSICFEYRNSCFEIPVYPD